MEEQWERNKESIYYLSSTVSNAPQALFYSPLRYYSIFHSALYQMSLSCSISVVWLCVEARCLVAHTPISHSTNHSLSVCHSSLFFVFFLFVSKCISSLYPLFVSPWLYVETAFLSSTMKSTASLPCMLYTLSCGHRQQHYVPSTQI